MKIKIGKDEIKEKIGLKVRLLLFLRRDFTVFPASQSHFLFSKSNIRAGRCLHRFLIDS
jgi:hypothetical protein